MNIQLLTIILIVVSILCFLITSYNVYEFLMHWRRCTVFKHYSKINLINLVWLCCLFMLVIYFLGEHIQIDENKETTYVSLYTFKSLWAVGIFLCLSFIPLICFIISLFNPAFKNFMFEKSRYNDYENMELERIHTEIESCKNLKHETYDMYEKLFLGIRNLESLKTKASTKIEKLRIAKQIEDFYIQRESLNKHLSNLNTELANLHTKRLEYEGEIEQKVNKENEEHIQFLRTFNVWVLNEKTGGAALKTIDDILNEAKAQV